jgi:hypothetical protein
VRLRTYSLSRLSLDFREPASRDAPSIRSPNASIRSSALGQLQVSCTTPESCNKIIKLLYFHSRPTLPQDPDAETLRVMEELGLLGKKKKEEEKAKEEEGKEEEKNGVKEEEKEEEEESKQEENEEEKGGEKGEEKGDERGEEKGKDPDLEKRQKKGKKKEEGEKKEEERKEPWKR